MHDNGPNEDSFAAVFARNAETFGDPLFGALWIPDPDAPGAAIPLITKADQRNAARNPNLGGSLASCVLYAGVQACAFDRPMRAEPTWNGKRYVANGWSLDGLAPDGSASRVRVAAVPGQHQFHPPAWPQDPKVRGHA